MSLIESDNVAGHLDKQSIYSRNSIRLHGSLAHYKRVYQIQTWTYMYSRG